MIFGVQISLTYVCMVLLLILLVTSIIRPNKGTSEHVTAAYLKLQVDATRGVLWVLIAALALGIR